MHLIEKISPGAQLFLLRAEEHRVISLDMSGKIRLMYFRDKLSLHQLAKRSGLSRNTIRKWVRAPETTSPARRWSITKSLARR